MVQGQRWSGVSLSAKGLLTLTTSACLILKTISKTQLCLGREWREWERKLRQADLPVGNTLQAPSLGAATGIQLLQGRMGSSLTSYLFQPY